MTPLPTLRAATVRDEPFFFRLYATTRAEELAQAGLSAADRNVFLRSQFDIRQKSYRTRFPHAVWSVLLLRGNPIGGLIVNRSIDEIRLINIALLPEHRGQGLGRGLCERLRDEAQETGRPLRLHVVRSNPARKLYESLGFAPSGIAGDYLEMEWVPQRKIG